MTSPAKDYDDGFYDFFESGVRRSSAGLVSRLFPVLIPNSVLDVGCGRGFWLSAWSDAGCPDIFGIDGDYINTSSLAVDPERFLARDLREPFDLGRRFDLVQCLEVAEHLPASASSDLIKGLTVHSDIVLFSAAVPGQGGIDHINEQPLQYWREIFESLGYHPFDFVRRTLRGLDEIDWWYRYNTILYASETGRSSLPKNVLTTEIHPTQSIPDFAPTGRRAAQTLLQLAPPWLVTRIASAYIRWQGARAKRT